MGLELGERTAIALIGDEDGVVPESLDPLRFGGNDTVAGAFGPRLGAVRPGHERNGPPARPAVGALAEHGQELAPVVLVGRVLAGIARREHAGRAVEGFDL